VILSRPVSTAETEEESVTGEFERRGSGGATSALSPKQSAPQQRRGLGAGSQHIVAVVQKSGRRQKEGPRCVSAFISTIYSGGWNKTRDGTSCIVIHGITCKLSNESYCMGQPLKQVKYRFTAPGLSGLSVNLSSWNTRASYKRSSTSRRVSVETGYRKKEQHQGGPGE
jgi:hypothetical protein